MIPEDNARAAQDFAPDDLTRPTPTCVSFVVPGRAVGKARPRMGRGGHVFTPAATLNAEGRVRYAAADAMQDRAPYAGACRVDVLTVTAPARSLPRWKRALAFIGAYDTRKPDADNVLKLVCDAMNGVVFVDDQQVSDVTMKKRLSPDGREFIRVTVTELAPPLPERKP